MIIRLLQPMKLFVFFVSCFVLFVFQKILEHKVHEEPQRTQSTQRTQRRNAIINFSNKRARYMRIYESPSSHWPSSFWNLRDDFTLTFDSSGASPHHFAMLCFPTLGTLSLEYWNGGISTLYCVYLSVAFIPWDGLFAKIDRMASEF
jgi:hypothetical protein